MVERIVHRLITQFIPPRLKARAYYSKAKLFGSLEKELVHLPKVILNRGLRNAVDVGANYGLYTVGIKKYFGHVYAFEINPEFIKTIEAMHASNVTTITCGLSDVNGTGTLFTPVLNGVRLHGWASLEKRSLDFTDIFEEKNFTIKKLDSFQLKAIDFIKIDVESHEVNVVKGAMDTISESLPILLIESGGHKLECIKSLLEPLHYRCLKLEDLIQVKGDGQNYFFIPSA